MPIKTRNIADGAVTAAKLGSDVTDLTTVDDTTIELNAGALRVKAAGIALAHLASEVTDILDLLTDLPTENVAAPGIWNDNGVLKVGTAE